MMEREEATYQYLEEVHGNDSEVMRCIAGNVEGKQ